MGITIGLSILPQRIDPLAWQKVYEESLKLLLHYPFASLKTINKEGFELAVYSSQVEHCPDDFSKRHWSVCGDLKTKKASESFCLYYDLRHYLNSTKNIKDSTASEDIVTTLLHDQAGGTRDVFYSKTQGNPYHNYVLALAMLFETRLAPYVLAEGIITLGQAQKAKKWADRILSEPLEIPVLLSPEKLQLRLEKTLHGLELIKAMNRVWIGDRQILFNHCLDTFGQDLLEEWFIGELKEFESANAVGTINKMILWLNGTGDLEKLAVLSCKKEGGPLFSVRDFCEAVAATWLTIPNEKYAFLKHFDLKAGQSETVETLLVDLVMKAGLASQKMEYYLPLSEANKILLQVFPGERDAIINTLEQEHSYLEELIRAQKKEMQPLLHLVETKAVQEADYGDVDELFLYYDENAPLDEAQDVLVHNIAALIQVAQDIHRLDELVEAAEKKGWKWIIYNAVELEKLIFTEDAWKWVDAEKDEQLLKILFTAVAIYKFSGMAANFGSFVRSLFENREFALKVKGLIGQ